MLLYIGSIAFYKGVDEIISAYRIAKKSIPNLNLVIGGKPDFQIEKVYKEWRIKHKDIQFVGFLSDEEIPYYYSLGDIFITYSFASEGFGLTHIEAIACGTPVICSSMTVYKEILKDNAIFVPPRDPQRLIKEIINLLLNKSDRDNLIQKAQKFITRYSWDSVGKSLEDIYSKFLNN